MVLREKSYTKTVSVIGLKLAGEVTIISVKWRMIQRL